MYYNDAIHCIKKNVISYKLHQKITQSNKLYQNMHCVT